MKESNMHRVAERESIVRLKFPSVIKQVSENEIEIVVREGCIPFSPELEEHLAKLFGIVEAERMLDKYATQINKEVLLKQVL